MPIFSVEVDKYNPTALIYCLTKLQNAIPDFEYDWRITVNAGGIDYGTFLNIDLENKTIEICNQPEGDGDDYLEDVINEILENIED